MQKTSSGKYVLLSTSVIFCSNALRVERDADLLRQLRL